MRPRTRTRFTAPAAVSPSGLKNTMMNQPTSPQSPNGLNNNATNLIKVNASSPLNNNNNDANNSTRIISPPKSGVKKSNIVMVDSKGVISKKRKDLNRWKLFYASNTTAKNLKEAIKNADVFLGLSAKDVVSKDMIKSGVIDPVKVVRSALENAASASGTLLTTEVTIHGMKEDQ